MSKKTLLAVPLGIMLATTGCMAVDTNAAGTAGAGNAATQGTSANPVTITGTSCMLDAATQVTLCAHVNTCLNLSIDPGLYPSCGFRAASTTLDPQCLCDDALCPIGVATDCTQLNNLLATKSALAVCTQVNDGTCVQILTSTTGSGGSTSNCDRTCAATCSGVLDCPKLCGC